MRLAELSERLLAGDRVALAKGITLVENLDPRREELLRLVAPHTGGAHVVGVTGAPGAGRSTLVDAMVSTISTSEWTWPHCEPPCELLDLQILHFAFKKLTRSSRVESRNYEQSCDAGF